MSDKTVTEAIQKDWKEREMIEIVYLNILKVSLLSRTHKVPLGAEWKYQTGTKYVARCTQHLPHKFWYTTRIVYFRRIWCVPPRRRQRFSFSRLLPVLQRFQNNALRVG